MMKLKRFWMMLSIALVGLCTVSCGGDDDKETDSNVKEKILGLWHRVGYNYTSDREFKDIYFNHINFLKDGTCECYRSYPDGYARVCTWSYNESSHMLRIYGDDGDYVFGYNFKLEFMDNGDWVGTEDGFSWIYSRKENTDDDDDISVANPVHG